MYAGYYNFGFNFNFDGTNYTYCVIYTSGIISLGPSVNGSYSNPNLGNLSTPTIGPYWAYMQLSGDQGGCGINYPTLKYRTLGSAPNRVFVVQWKDFQLSHWSGSTYGYGYRGTFESRLYESPVPGQKGKVEFFYQELGATSCSYYGASGAHIGMGTSNSNFLFVKYSGATPSLGYSGIPSMINGISGNSKPSNGSLYIFQALPDVQLSAYPKTLNYGTVSAGASVDLCVTVKHAGTEGTLTFNAPTLLGSLPIASSVHRPVR
jgi:hypothetical protein